MRELLSRLLRRPASRVVEAPVRELVHDALSGQDLPSAADLNAVKHDLERANVEIQELAGRVDALGQTVESLRAERDALLAEKAAARAAPPAKKKAPSAKKEAPPPKKKAPPAKVKTPAKGAAASSPRACKVPDCAESPKSRGFCKTHYATWRRSGLDGFVGPEGLIDHGGQALRVSMKHQGKAVAVSGKKRLSVKIAGDKVDFDALS